jgi:hypothetical protein
LSTAFLQTLLDAVERGVSIYGLDDAIIEFLSASRNLLGPGGFNVFRMLVI